MAKQERSYPEPNPHDEAVKATRWLLTSMLKRQQLYHYLRELPDDNGTPGDVGPRWAEQLTTWSDQYVAEKDGFKPEEVEHINKELGHIYRLKFKAYGYVRGL